MLDQLMTLLNGYGSDIQAIAKEFADFTKVNPVFGGMVGLWLMGVITFILKDVPRKIGNFLDRYLTVSVTMDNYHEAFYYFVKWYEKNKDVTKNRTMRITNGRYGGSITQIALGLGDHYFLHSGWAFKLNRSKLDSGGSEAQKEEITLKTVGLTQNKLHKLIKSTIPDKKEESNYIYLFKDDWTRCEELPKRKLESVILKAGQKDRIIDFISEFQESKNWYNEMGVSYKTGIILHGPPGTGKTSIVKALSCHLKKNLCVISCTGVSDSNFMKALTSMPENSIALMEDFDSITSTQDRDTTKLSGFEMTSLSGLLNAIDGVFSNEGRILIATTNKIYNLDPALLRPGRFDLKEEISYADKEMVTRMFKKFYPDFYLGSFNLSPEVSLAQVENCFLEFKKDPKKAKELVEKLIKEDVKKLNFSDIYQSSNSDVDAPEVIGEVGNVN